ncbi:MAG: hypothetical protein ABIS35_14480 [Terracoccus sp.]
MPRPLTRRRALATALVGAATSASLLVACTGDSGGTTATPTASPTSTPALAAAEATTAGTAALSEAITARADTGATGAAARTKAYTGPALESANAWAKSLPALTDTQKADNELTSEGATLLAVSTAGTEPRQMLFQATLKKSGNPVLALLTSEATGDPFKVAALATVVPSARLDAFSPTTLGSDPVSAATDLVATPDAVATSFAQSVRYPDPVTSTVLATDALSDQLRTTAAAQAKAVADQGTFSQAHVPQGQVGGFQLTPGNGVIVFEELARTDRIALRNPVKLTPGKDVTAITGIATITTEAQLTSNEVVAFVIPASGQATVVAASDQLVSGTAK